MIRLTSRWANFVSAFLVIIASLSFAVHRSNEDARQALAASDRAFDNGDLKRSMLEARSSAMSALPKSAHLRDSLERLSAIAVGSESAGRMKTALLSRMSLLSLVQSRGAKVDPSLAPQSSEQIRFLIDKVASSTVPDRFQSDSLVIDPGSSPGAVSVSLLLIALAAAIFNWETMPRLARSRVTPWLIPLAAMVAWFAAWFTA